MQRLTALEAELCRVDSSDPTLVSAILDACTQNPHLKQQSAHHRQVYMIISLFLSIVPEFAEYLLPCHSFTHSKSCAKTFDLLFIMITLHIYQVLGNLFLFRTEATCFLAFPFVCFWGRLDVIDRCFSGRTVEEIIAALVSFSSI